MILVGLGIALKFSRAEVAIKANKIEALSLAKEVLQSDLNIISDKVELIEKEKQALRLEAEKVSKLNQLNASAKKAIEAKFRHQSRLLDQIRGSSNETVKAWVATTMPNDAVVLLKQASYCALPTNHADEICISSRRNGK